MRLFLFTTALLILLLTIPVRVTANQGLTVRESIRANEELAKKNRESLTKLTTRERELHGDLAAVADELDGLRDKVFKHEAALAGLDRRIDDARAEHQRLTRNQDAAYRELGKLVQSLWPLRVADLHARQSGTEGWPEADRRFTWGAALYADVQQALADIEDRGRRLGDNIKRQQDLRTRAEHKLSQVNTAKDEMLAKRLAFARSIREVRAERVNREQAMEQVLAAIEDLEYRLKNTEAGSFEDLKGALPWPVDGKRLSSEAVRAAGLRGGGGRDGAGFSVTEGSQVRAVFWGRVVHDDLLRGYGRVVILSHGGNWYSLYAFLEKSFVTQGHEVEKDEPLGKAGYYPAAKGPGLYFELRSGQKAINPVEWLAKRR